MNIAEVIVFFRGILYTETKQIKITAPAADLWRGEGGWGGCTTPTVAYLMLFIPLLSKLE